MKSAVWGIARSVWDLGGQLEGRVISGRIRRGNSPRLELALALMNLATYAIAAAAFLATK